MTIQQLNNSLDLLDEILINDDPILFRFDDYDTVMGVLLDVKIDDYDLELLSPENKVMLVHIHIGKESRERTARNRMLRRY